MEEQEKQDRLKREFEEKLSLKHTELERLKESLQATENYKEIYNKRMEDNMIEIAEKAKDLVTSIDEAVKEINTDMGKKREKDFEALDKSCEEIKTLKTKFEKKLAYFKQVFDALPDDNDIVEQFVADSTPKLHSMAIFIHKDFPKPLKLTPKSIDVKTCFGKIEEDAYFSVTGGEKSKYRSKLEVELKFKPEPNRSAIFGIQIRPDGKAWITTLNSRILLVLRTGHIYDECMVRFLPVYTAVNKYGHLYCTSGQTSAIIRVKKDFDMNEFADLAPYKALGLHVTEDEHLLVCLQGPEKSKVVKFSEMGMLVQEIVLGTEGEPIFKAPRYLTQNGSGQICVSDDRHLIIVEPSGKKYVKFQPTDETWEGKSITVDRFDNLISVECPKKIRPQNIHVMNSSGENVKTFQLEGPNISGLNALAIDYQYDEPVMWVGTIFGDVIITKFMNSDI